MRALGCPAPPPGGRPRPPPGGRTLGEAEGEGSEVVGDDGESIGSIGPASACGGRYIMMIIIMLAIIMMMMMIIIMLSKSR